jgi:N-dimethylarginine dimethylaminohydrolase
VRFEGHISYHIDCTICPIDEGLIGMQKGALWTPLPDGFKDREVIDIALEEQKIGVCNAVPLGDKKIIIPEGAPKLVGELEKRGYTAIEIPYATNYTTTGSGIHCSIAPIWREY